MTVERTITLSILDLGHIEVALEAYIEDAIDTRMHAEPVGSTPETSTEDYRAEMAEFDVIVEEGQALLERIKAALRS